MPSRLAFAQYLGWLERWKESEQQYQKLSGRYPGLDVAQGELAAIYVIDHQEMKAWRELRSARNLSIEDGLLLERIGDFCKRTGDPSVPISMRHIPRP